MTNRTIRGVVLAGATCLAALAGGWPGGPSRATAAAPIYLAQQWTQAQRDAFYSQDQGSRLIPLAWLRALKTADGRPFLYDQLARYGYLASAASVQKLPVGFTVTGNSGALYAGMTCAACHTREIDIDGQPYRIDGGPALVDFQAFLTDLVGAVGGVLNNDGAFAGFAANVLGDADSSHARDALRQDVQVWYTREQTLVARALPRPDMWGLGRLDAISMILNRVSGLDVGPAPTYLIASNIQPADAPVRYPFLWNAARQDKTQWPGIADNGDNLLGLARNLGEVYGVFATFHPSRSVLFPLTRADFINHNSANFPGLANAENLIAALGAPKWPGPVDAALTARGEAIFGTQCASCHAVRPGARRLGNAHTWATPLQDVGTDAREYTVLARQANTGAIAGARVPFVGPTLGPTAPAIDMLKVSVLGAVLQDALFHGGLVRTGPGLLDEQRYPSDAKKLTGELKGLYAHNPTLAQPHNYESRVLYGIWAAAPYLHNGSVPTLADLLEPSSKRPQSFAVGRAYDLKRVGLAKDQAGSYVRRTTDCANQMSGDSRCGHEGPGFGTDLSSDDKKALLEYLKTL